MDHAATARQPAFRLADHVRACAMSDQIVLLDLRHSRYLALGLRQWEVLNGTRNLMPAGQRHGCHPDPASETERLAAPLLRQRILTRAMTRGQTGASAQPPEASLDVRGVMPFSAIGAGRVWRFAAAACWAAAALRLRSLSFSVDRVAKRAARLHHPQANDPTRLRDAVAAFDTLRPLLFTSRDKCLYDSLTLVSFLAGEGLAAQWVIGVKTRPFAAHSWVQAGTVVLNDLHEHVRSFRPILVV
jgi:hypothetical protein